MNHRLSAGVVGRGFGMKMIVPSLHEINVLDIKAIAGGHTKPSLDTTFDNPLGIKNISYDSMIRDPSIDVIFIATPPHTHYKLAKLAIEHGKHVLCEKPFTTSLSEAIALHRLGIKYRKILCCNYQFRFDDLIIQCENVIQKGLLGELKSITITWSTGGALNKNRVFSWRDSDKYCHGVLTEWTSHVFDYISILARSSMITISCELSSRITQRRDLSGNYCQVTVPDTCSFDGSLENGVKVFGSISTSEENKHGHHIQLSGSLGDFSASIQPPYSAKDLRFQLHYKDKIPIEISPNLLTPNDTRYYAIQKNVVSFLERIHNPYLLTKSATSFDAARCWESMDAAIMSSTSRSSLIHIVRTSL